MPESLVPIANRKVPFPKAASWAGIAPGGSNKTYCPFGFEHDDGGSEQAFRVYDDHGYCFAGGHDLNGRDSGYFTVVRLLSLHWEVSAEDAAAEALRRVGWKPASYAHLWEDVAREPEPDRDALRAALIIFCTAQCPDWQLRQYDDAAAGMLARCFGLLRLVRTTKDCGLWLERCKQAMLPYLS